MTRLLLPLILLLATLTQAQAETLSGVAQVHDGDTIRIGDTRVRIWGIDAPELEQSCGIGRCGVMARDALAVWIAGRVVTCEPRGKSWDRVVAVCAIDGADVAAWLVAQGWAVDWESYSSGAYAPQQAEAAAHDRGIWAAPFRLEKSGVSGE